ncbi:DMT family transporter [Anaeroselena agilis]|uniref:DMT family transporter n=1 Tax=Anaeroselena agilis TaxID=3063788 RepID=A0ABU3NVE1_9FIRM|nr:DMT family transporter [Selenomonadales bacterium 4137-cl]
MPTTLTSTRTAWRRLSADLSLIAVAFVWGVTFVAVKSALAAIGVFTFLAIRFAIAFLFLALLFRRRLAAAGWPAVRASLVIGAFLFAGYAFQTAGLQYTTASSAGFITGLAVVLVPCLAAASRRLPGRPVVVGAGLSVAGLALLTLNNGLAVSYGDLLVFFCAISFALHIIATGRYAPRFDAKILATLQIGATALMSGLVAASSETMPALLTTDVLIALAVTAIPATALAFLVQTTAQQFTTPSRTAIIFALEPVFAALAGIVLLGETLSGQQILGCVLILAGTLASELLPDRDSA